MILSPTRCRPKLKCQYFGHLMQRTDLFKPLQYCKVISLQLIKINGKKKRKDPDAGNDWRWEEKGTTEDEMVGWHHRLNGHEFEQAPGVGDGQGSLACCSPWGHKGSDTTEWLNWTEMQAAAEIWGQVLWRKVVFVKFTHFSMGECHHSEGMFPLGHPKGQPLGPCRYWTLYFD